MSDKPILFSAPMVRAILREIEQPGTGKTQTRRVIPQPEMTAFGWNVPWQVGGGSVLTDQSDAETIAAELLNGIRIQVGDRLYLREAWHGARSLDSTPPRDIPRDADIEHAATARSYAEIGLKGKLRPGMFLPRWASRITLIVTDVRVQRLQEISSGDAAAEGVEHDSDGWRDYQMQGTQCCANARASFRTLWDSLNASRGHGWEANPWVAAYTFRPILGNIDQIGGDA